jgi:hypothetical protein
MRWAGHVVCTRERRETNILVGKPETKKPFRRPRHRWEANIEMDLKEIGCESFNLIKLAENRGQW